jgi:predicted enzyme related to lactoylglutathione lyase
MNRTAKFGLAAILLATLGIANAKQPLPLTGPREAVSVAPQYDTTHVYVQPEDFDRFVSSLIATFGGITTKQGVFTVTPTPSSTMSQLALTSAGSVSVFGFKTPVPFPFGTERTGYLVTDMDAAVRSVKANGGSVVVAPFNDPIGKDVIVEWPGGVRMQLYWHTQAPSYPALETIPENRVYVSPNAVKAFTRAFLGFAHGKVVSDDPEASGIEIGRPDSTFRRIRIESPFGRMVVLVTDGHLPYPYGWELTGYEVSNLDATLSKATAAGVTILTGPYASGSRNSAMVMFPGGYIAEVHTVKH